MAVKRETLLPVVLMSLFFAGCVAMPARTPKTQLQTRQVQTREFDTSDTRLVMKALLNVLQDDGFIPKNAVMELGLITATKETDVANPTESFFGLMLQGHQAVWAKNSIIEASANVSEFGNKTRVRINFLQKVLDNRGGIVSVQEIENGFYYQEFFAKVDKGIFLQRQRI